ANCGMCGLTCATGEVCSAGQCALTCVGGTTQCGNACTDLARDPANCGMCGLTCATGEVCSAGQCALTCVGGTSKCGNACTDTTRDPANCGMCGLTCATGEVCSAGQCALSCVGGTTRCGNACTSLAFDPLNCGMCGLTCAGGANASATCSSGNCGLACGAGFLNCNGSSADGCEKNGATDLLNCGSCGTACPAIANGTPTCTGGSCGASCSAGFADCDGMPGNGCEVALTTSSTHCGMCGRACTPAEDCSAGTCVMRPLCSNGSSLDCNVAGTTLGTPFVDLAPPATWTQCAGFVNTAADDVTANFLDNCLNTTRLRVRVFTSTNTVEEDISVATMTSWAAWPSFAYLGGTPVFTVKTNWGSTSYFTNTDGRDACLQVAAPSGTVFGTGNGSVAVIAGGNTGYGEYRINCSGMFLPDRKVALYR
ncbi:MAG: hypothetical protein Q8L48_32240, partial [Archangium sp.]|nr:hypothetical protein [Archangium sp.]